MTKKLIFDYDCIVYQVGFACEKRAVEVTHTATGVKQRFDNKTEFWGRKKNVIEGWLGEKNKERVAQGKREFTKDEFTMETIREADNIQNALHSVKEVINKALRATGCDEYMGYIGDGDSFRLDRSTIYKYKGSRDNALTPLLKKDIIDYLVKYHAAEIVQRDEVTNEMLEADDMVIIKALEDKENSVVYAVDKDATGSPIFVFNPNRPDDGIKDCACFGEINLIERTIPSGIVKEIKGHGRKFFYFQVAFGDDVDDYRANCASDIEWGEISAYKALADCNTDKECLEALVGIYQHLYPEPKTVLGWRGDEIEIDWLYVLNEIWDLARMRRSPDDIVTAEEVLRKFKIIE